MSIVRANRWQRTDGSTYGTVLQTVSVTKTDTFSTSVNASAGGSIITGLSATIIPYSTSNKILLFCTLNCAGTNGVTQVYTWLARGVNKIGVGDAASTRTQIGGRFYHPDNAVAGMINMHVLDSPATTSSITYNVYMGAESSGAVYLNRTVSDTDNTTNGTRSASMLTLMEIQA
jgi:hypothetical protein